MHEFASRGLAAAALRVGAACAALLLVTSSAAPAARSGGGQEPPFDPRTDQETAPPSPREHPTEAGLIEAMSADAYVAPELADPSRGPRRPGAGPRLEAGGAGGAPASFGIEQALREPISAPDGAGGLWVRTKCLKTHFRSDSVTAYPVFGPAAERHWPVRLALSNAALGGEALELRAGTAPRLDADGRRVEVERGSLTEAWNLRAGAIEQTFVFDELPRREGDLEVRIAVETDLAASEVGDALVFAHEGLGRLSYGAAFAVDGAGRRSPIERRFDGATITLTVPAAFLAAAALPVTIDPPLIGFGNSFGVADDLTVDVCYAGEPGAYFVTWEDYTTATDSDVYLTSFSATGVQGATRLVDGSTEWWGTPSIGYLAGHDRILVASAVSPNGPGAFPSQIRGHVYDPAAAAFTEVDFPISSSGSEKMDPVVGGANADLTANNHFIVAWSRILASDRWSIEYRVVDFDSAAVTPIQVFADASGVRNRQPAASASHGDANLLGDYWTLAWNANPSASFFGFGRIMARRIVFSGNAAFGGGSFTVNSGANCSNPSVTSRFDRAYGAIPDRPSLVAYTVHDFGDGLRGDIVVNAVTAGSAGPPNPVTLMEDFDDSLDQRQPAIGCDGRAFILAYSQVWFQSSDDHDISMCSGTIAEDGGDVRIGLSKRNQIFSNAFGIDVRPSIAMVHDGQGASISDRGLVGWLKDDPAVAADGSMWFQTVEAGTTETNPDRNAVGRQYCDANTHSGAPPYGPGLDRPAASWIWVEGDQVAGHPHDVHCVEMPTNVFSLLLCSRQTGDVNLAGGLGRLCLGGSIGRFNALITGSGPGGSSDFAVDTGALPQGLGATAAQPGETWHFQVWHRDFFPAGATSNYSNTASVTFTP